ncbi:hypothetical protein Tco_1001740, partial [Tanacetum coccineum]
MSAKDKNGLRYGIQLDEISNKSKTDSEISMSVFENRSSDEEISPANDRFSKADGYHAVLPPITGNFLTPRANISFADELNFKLLDESQVILRAPKKDDVYSMGITCLYANATADESKLWHRRL